MTPAPALKPCPWCGALPTVQPWHGGGPRKHMVACYDDYCEVRPGVCGSTRLIAIEKWNRRTPTKETR